MGTCKCMISMQRQCHTVLPCHSVSSHYSFIPHYSKINAEIWIVLWLMRHTAAKHSRRTEKDLMQCVFEGLAKNKRQGACSRLSLWQNENVQESKKERDSSIGSVSDMTLRWVDAAVQTNENPVQWPWSLYEHMTGAESVSVHEFVIIFWLTDSPSTCFL